MEQGLVHLPQEAPWLDAYLRELTSFPNGRHDDQVDSTTQALAWLKAKAGTGEQGWIEYAKEQLELMRKEDDAPETLGWNKAIMQRRGLWRW